MTHEAATSLALTVFQGRAGDHNDRGIAGAAVVGHEIARRWALEPTVVGVPEPPLSTSWDVELDAALPTLRAMAARYEEVHAAGLVPVTAISRCAVALATLPVVARHHPDAVVLWFDAHADLNLPGTTTTGYLGGLAFSGPLGLWDSGLGAGLAPGAGVLVGARDIDPPEQRLIHDGAVTLVGVGPDLLDELGHAVGDRPVYLHLDCDVLEPGIVPTDYRVPGGLTLADLRAVAELLAGNRVVGVEIGELEADGVPGDGTAGVVALLDALAPLIDSAATGHRA